MSVPSKEIAAIRVARALGDPTRFRLLKAIAARAETSCLDLTARVGLAQATVSHHLKILSEAGLVSVRRAGAFHLYRLHAEALAEHGEALARAFSTPRRRGRERRAA